MRVSITAAIVFLVSDAACFGEFTLVSRGSVWKYYPGPRAANWQLLEFDDRAWQDGVAPLGYGDGDEQTVLFDDWRDAPSTLYFRRTFVVTNRADIFSATMQLLADDGAVVYLNGTEIARRNMPAGPISHETRTPANVETNENTFIQYGVRWFNFRSGTNVIAVEVHQHPAGLLDCSFDLELLANLPIQRPAVNITSPVDGAVLNGEDILIETATSDPAGHVVRVGFYTNGVLLAEVTGEPFSLRWPAPGLGRYQLTARAYGIHGAAGDSQPVHVQVGGPVLPRLLRGPYLQCGSATGMVLRWRTDWFSDSVVRYGTNASSLTRALTKQDWTTDHEVKLNDLQPDTAYYYSIGSSAEMLGGGTDFYFRTAPREARPVRFWVIGDSGTGDANAADVRDAYYTASGAEHTDVWLMLGDNAYGGGTDYEYQTAVFDLYGDLLRQTVLWPTLGNHDAGDDPSVFGTGGTNYQEIFTLPKNGESGGLASGTELYYSFDHANIHVVCLDSFLSDRSPQGAMLTWLSNDLAATDREWIIAFWHHPPYSWGSHNSDTDIFAIQMREWVLPILEEYGVDLVLGGHSHVYERSVLLDGHYSFSWTFNESMMLDDGSGFAGGAGPYRKPAGGMGSHRGTVYTVCGCSGAGGFQDGFERHPAMALNRGGFGSMILEVDGLRLRARFLRPSGQVEDDFTIDKSAPTTIRPELQISRDAHGAVISWPSSHPAFRLESADSLSPLHWGALVPWAVTNGRRNIALVETNGAGRFFRLRAAP